ncbi:MocR-like pyridoxine biosynthesis transcription factor PdxR [Paenibacillus sp. 481]|uniref:MocR-like pyridoxine biosynthesis transcription factor PdxR n=1 Tax=Paenibacillus sp. 481 TaxID=2835869 RepID=UPI001E61A889|nr:PLP-dependent aminotransferase family protein [Paenibacillus sp. 481]UHA73574.1 PLP-dependent aminotransferase family protein [Paenibacillus sp. 481]
MEWKPNRNISMPVYRQIAAYIEERISCGELPPGSLLPSERELAQLLQVNRSTVVSAYDQLRSFGIVQREQGSGTRVSKDMWGSSKVRVPNWKRMIDTGAFASNQPLMQTIRKVVQECNANMIDLASGELAESLYPTEALRRIIAEQSFDMPFGYGHLQGYYPLRQTLAEQEHHMKQIDCTPSSILITSGVQQALHLVAQCLLKAGDTVAIENPSYCYSLPMFHKAGIRTCLLSVDRHGIDPEQLVQLHRKQRIKMIFVNPNYHNPTGTVLSYERRLRLLHISAEYGIPIVEDDPYSLTSYDGQVVPTLKSLDRNGSVLYISSLTKIVSSGIRMGWVIGPQAVIERLTDAKQQIDFGHSVVSQWVANQFIRSDAYTTHLIRLRRELKQRKDAVISSLQQMRAQGIPIEELAEPQGGIHVWCKLHATFPASRLLKEAIQRDVIYVPGIAMGQDERCVRFSYGKATPAQLEAALQRFSAAWAACN